MPPIESLHRLQYWEIQEYQLYKIKEILAGAFENVPYYRRQWKMIGFHPDDIQSFKDIETIPILTKQVLREKSDQLLSKNAIHSKLFTSGTGGTTDSPIIIKYDKKRLLFKNAEMHYFRRW